MSTEATSPSSSRWLFGPLPDLLLGCGLLYAILFVIFGAAGSSIRSHQAPYLFPLLVILLSTPHYGGTLLRVYEQRRTRREYVLFSLHATVLIAALFVAGIYNSFIGACFFTLYITWSPWHYTGQNYGLAMMFLRRRRVNVTLPAKRWLYASFVLSYFLTFIVLHESLGSATDIPVAYTEGTPVRFLPLRIPSSVSSVLIGAVASAYVLSLCVAGVLLGRGTRLADLVPAGALALTQALWFSIPLAIQHWGVVVGIEPLDSQHRAHYFFWIALGHAVQYLWVTTYYARSSGSWSSYPNYLGKTLLAGTAVWILPAAVFAPSAMGRVSFDTGLALLIASAVNIHHFVLDGAIWKLRNSRIASVLIRAVSPSEENETPRDRRWLKRTVWGVALATVVVQGIVFWNYRIVYEKAIEREDYETARVALDRCSWFGFDRAVPRGNLGRRFAEVGDLEQSLSQFERSIELMPMVEAYEGVGFLHQQRKDWPLALEAYESALELQPDNPDLLCRAATALLRLKGVDEARGYVDRALRSQPEHPASLALRERLDRRKRGTGNPE